MKNSALAIVTTLALFFLVSNSFCQDQHTDIFAEKNIAIKGYDPVAYFTLGEPTKGSASFQTQNGGVKWYFSSQQHLEMFKENPQKYLPQYGGYCAFGLAEGYKVSISPTAWAIVNDKLYLNYNQKIQKQWSENTDILIKKGDENWKALKNKSDKK
ncbi:YHS domain-containing (seleno)protein [Aquiflexum sp.]|uniref:YHS domain-containing (seleno)protein n=1 Tax=Aquiflexum sp. TaxID=1872584 RepID=UPI00359415F2